MVIALAVNGCHPATERAAERPRAASAELRDAGGRTVGRAALSETQGGVRIVLDVAGLPPGTKGFHVHEVGRCEPPSFESASAHANPTGAQHGSANPRGPHAGDFPNLVVDARGGGHADVTTDRLTLGAGPASVFDADGSAIVVHADPDDLRTDPAGNSGDRLVCGVIVRAAG